MSALTTQAVFHESTSAFSWLEKPAYLQLRHGGLLAQPNGLIRGRDRILQAGQLGAHTACSLINPGALHRDGAFHLLCRGEPNDRTWLGYWADALATPVWCRFDDQLRLTSHCALRYVGLPPRQRAEDWRLFEYEGQLFTNHSVYLQNGPQLQCRPGISTIDLGRRQLVLRHILRPPFEPSTEEKNWAFFVHDGALLCVYSFNPYIVLQLDVATGATAVVIEGRPVHYEWIGRGGRFVSNSTNPIVWSDDDYIMFIHDHIAPEWPEQRNRLYMQYAVLLSRTTLLPTGIVPTPLLIGGNEQGRHPGVHYTTSLVNGDDALYAFYGEGDTHSGVVVFDKMQLADLFASHRL
jgi:hypothetical protein